MLLERIVMRIFEDADWVSNPHMNHQTFDFMCRELTLVSFRREVCLHWPCSEVIVSVSTWYLAIGFYF